MNYHAAKEEPDSIPVTRVVPCGVTYKNFQILRWVVMWTPRFWSQGIAVGRSALHTMKLTHNVVHLPSFVLPGPGLVKLYSVEWHHLFSDNITRNLAPKPTSVVLGISRLNFRNLNNFCSYHIFTASPTDLEITFNYLSYDTACKAMASREITSFEIPRLQLRGFLSVISLIEELQANPGFGLKYHCLPFLISYHRQRIPTHS